jgi:hypothetical protein
MLAMPRADFPVALVSALSFAPALMCITTAAVPITIPVVMTARAGMLPTRPVAVPVAVLTRLGLAALRLRLRGAGFSGGGWCWLLPARTIATLVPAAVVAAIPLAAALTVPALVLLTTMPAGTPDILHLDLAGGRLGWRGCRCRRLRRLGRRCRRVGRCWRRLCGRRLGLARNKPGRL